jgi:transposase-like protein
MGQQHRHPVGGVDYPRTIMEFDRWFATEEACISYLARVRWPDGFVCPACGGHKAWPTARGQMRCATCQRQTSVTAGTMLEGTRKPLRIWFQAMWHVTSQKYGCNALGLKRIMGFGSYQTAWSWLHKMRRAMVRPGRDRLSGRVEVDEIYVGGREEGASGRYTEKKSIVVVAAEILEPKGLGRVRFRRVPDVTASSLMSAIQETVESGSVVLTDGWQGYARLTEYGYTHEVTVVSDFGDPAHVAMPGVHRVASLLKRWLLGTLQGAISNEHLDYYLDEFAFRFNRRKSRARGLLFYRLVQQAVQTSPMPYHQLVGGASHTGDGEEG